MNVDFSALARKQYISVRGDSLRYKVRCQRPIPKGQTHIYVNWFLASTKHQSFITGVWRKCSGENLTHLFCLKATANSRSNKTYIIIGNIRPYYDENSLNNRQKISWNDASELCRRSGADLLSFLNRDDLDEFIAMVLKSAKIPFIEAVFIGLKYNETEVSEQTSVYLLKKFPNTKVP